MNIDTGEKRRVREDLRELARPQYGVDALDGAFPCATRDIPGVSDKKE